MAKKYSTSTKEKKLDSKPNYEGLEVEVFGRKPLTRKKLFKLLKLMPRGVHSFDMFFDPHKAKRLEIPDHLFYEETPLDVGLMLLDEKKYFHALIAMAVNYPNQRSHGNHYVYIAPKLCLTAEELHPHIGSELRDYRMEKDRLFMAFVHNELEGKTSPKFTTLVAIITEVLPEEDKIVIDEYHTKNVMSLYQFRRNMSSLCRKWKKSEKKYK